MGASNLPRCANEVPAVSVRIQLCALSLPSLQTLGSWVSESTASRTHFPRISLTATTSPVTRMPTAGASRRSFVLTATLGEKVTIK